MILYWSIVLVIYFLDQLSKVFVGQLLSSGSSISIINNVFHLTLVHNKGAAFGMMQRHPYIFIVIAVISIAVIVYFLIKKKQFLSSGEKIALCFILGGTIGNLTDRLRVGYVIDFIDLRVWPVFNVADSFITVGAVLLGWALLMNRNKTIEQ